MGKYVMTNIEQNDVADMQDPYSFEKYCRNCDLFPGDGLYKPGCDYSGYMNGDIVPEDISECPFHKMFVKRKLNGDSEWKKIGCNRFMD